MITATQLQPFCADPDARPSRPVLHKPYVRNGKTYATDGSVIIRVPYAVPDVELNDNGPDADKVLDPIPAGGLWFKPQLADGVGENKPCPTCDQDSRLCIACGGEAEVTGKYVYNGKEYGITGPCPICDGAGMCDECSGTGTVTDDTPTKVGLNWYKAFYLRHVMALPGAELCGSEYREPSRIRFDGGDGALIPLDVDAWNDRCKAHGDNANMIVEE
jgi:hypothetical protein